MNIVQISDCHLFADLTQCGYGEVSPYQSLMAVLKKINMYDTDLMLITGDISNDYSRQSYLHLKHLLSEHCPEIPYLILPGNHDDNAIITQLFIENCFAEQAHSAGGNWNIYGLNSQHQGANGMVSEAQLERMEDSINRSDIDNWLIAVHHHPIPCNGWMDKHEWINRQCFVDKVSQLGKIKLVIYGHIHQVCETTLGACDFLSCPSTCWQWKKQESFGMTSESAGFRLIQLMPEGSYKSEIVRI